MVNSSMKKALSLESSPFKSSFCKQHLSSRTQTRLCSSHWDQNTETMKALISAQLLIELIQQRFSGDQTVANDAY